MKYITLFICLLAQTLLSSELEIFSYSNMKLEKPEEASKALRCIEANRSTLKAVSFSGVKLTDKDFGTFTEYLSLEKNPMNNLEILDLSCNALTKECSKVLISWLTLENIKYINITENPSICLKNVRLLHDAFKADGIEDKIIKGYMEKFIFITHNYVKTASEKVTIYKTLAAESIISSKWDKVHKAFYKSELSKKIKKLLKKNKAIHKQIAFNIFLKNLTPIQVQGLPSEENSLDESNKSSSQEYNRLGKALSKLVIAESSSSKSSSSDEDEKSLSSEISTEESDLSNNFYGNDSDNNDSDNSENSEQKGQRDLAEYFLNHDDSY